MPPPELVTVDAAAGFDAAGIRVAAALEAGAALGGPFLSVMGDDPEPERIAETFARLTPTPSPYGLRPLIEPIPSKAVRSLQQAVAAR